ncbi:MAG TPA: cation transporter [Chloroflexota bacterium]|nr:cation transporter [Chloroflexota bacterium]
MNQTPGHDAPKRARAERAARAARPGGLARERAATSPDDPSTLRVLVLVPKVLARRAARAARRRREKPKLLAVEASRLVPIADARQRRLRRRAWWLTGLTIASNTGEAVSTIASGLLSHSIALVAFGLGSLAEVGSGLVMAWRLSREGPDQAANERAERRALRLIGLSFLGIAAYVVFESIAELLGIGVRPQQSIVGLILVGLSLAAMPGLVWAKRRVAADLGSPALEADAMETQVCMYLGLVALIGLVANRLFGWWWMDPIAGLGVAAIALKEGQEAWKGGSSEADRRAARLGSALAAS